MNNPRYIFHIFLGIAFCLLASCLQQPDPSSMEIIKLDKVSEIEEFSDSTFFSDIRFMDANNGFLYVSDYTRNQIMVLKDTVLKQTISSNGQAPHELLGACAVIARGDRLWVLDDAKREILLFHGGTYIRSLKIPVATAMFSMNRFGLLGDNLILNDFQDSTSLVFVNTRTNAIMSRFGNVFEFDSPTKKRIRNARSVLTSRTHIYALSNNQPIIERYDAKGHFMDQYNYSDLNVLTEQLEYIQNQPNKDNEKSVYILVNDAYFYNDHLYVLLVSRENNRLQSNKIVEIRTKGDMQAKRVFDLGEDTYIQSFCIESGNLWAFEGVACVLIKYEMP